MTAPTVKISSADNYCLVEPQAPLSRADFEAIAAHVDPLIEREGRLDALVIRTRKFPGWESLGDLVEHMKFVRNHHRKIERVALVTDAALARIVPLLAGHFVQAEIRRFDFDDFQAALDWVTAKAPAA